MTEDKALAYLKREISALSGFGDLTEFGRGSLESMLAMLRNVYGLRYVKHVREPDEFVSWDN